MVKVKKKLSELTQQKRAQKHKKQLNPFEIHINKDKQKILGRKNINERGLPGISRAKAINRRKQSFLQEYKIKSKDNVFLDKRIGEKKSAMSTEDKTMARFSMELMKVYKKKDIYNLNNNEEFSHVGHILEEVEKFDDPRSDDEFSDEESSGKLDKDFVEGAHFAGGILSKPNSALSRKDLIDQLIVESKQRKAEKQKIREQTIDLTEKLDSEWRDLVPLMSTCNKSNENTAVMTKADAYDIALRELQFECRGNPSEKLKSEEETVQEEKERLEALETNRLARMQGFISNANNECKHRSADDLDDGLLVETVVEDANDNKKDISDDDNEDTDIDDDNDDINDNEHRTTMGSTTEKKGKSIKDKDNNGICLKDRDRTCSESSNSEDKLDIESNNKNAADGDSDSKDSEDNFSDLKESESSSEDGSEITEKHIMFANNLMKETQQLRPLSVVGLKSILKQNKKTMCIQSSSDKDKQQEIRNDLKRKEIMEKARKELPYTYNIPENFEELEKLVQSYNSEYQFIIVDRIIKCNHWTLDGKNKEKLSNLFVYLLQHIHNFASTCDADDLVRRFQVFDR